MFIKPVASCQLPACHVGQALRDRCLAGNRVGWQGPAHPFESLLVGYVEHFLGPGRETQNTKLPLLGNKEETGRISHYHLFGVLSGLPRPPASLGSALCTQMSRSLAALSTCLAQRCDPPFFQDILSPCILEGAVVWGVLVEQFLVLLGCCQPVRTFKQRQKLLLLIFEGNQIYAGGPGRASRSC